MMPGQFFQHFHIGAAAGLGLLSIGSFCSTNNTCCNCFGEPMLSGWPARS